MEPCRRPPLAVVLAIMLLLILAPSGCGRAAETLAWATVPTDAPTAAPATATAAPTPTAEPPTATPQPTATPVPSPTPGPAPHVVASHPIPGDLAVQPHHALTLVFDRPMDHASVEASLSVSPAVGGVLEWPSDTEARLLPDGGWVEPSYTVTLAAGARGAEGGALEAPLVLEFATGGRGVPVPALMYHHVLDLEPDATETERTWTVSPEAFAAQMAYLLGAGYESVHPTALADYMELGAPLPLRPVIITMDDGNREVYETVYPLLKDTRLRPMLYVIPSHMGYGAYLTWEMTREMAAAGFYVGVHTYDHVALRGVGEADLQVQIQEARAVLEAELGGPIDSFCYPFGSYDDAAVEALRRYGYRTAFTLNPLAYQPYDEPLLLNRLRVDYPMTLEEFIGLLP